MMNNAWRRLRRPPPHERPTHDWTLVFSHLPKTAGTALRDALEQVYLPAERLYLYDEPALAGAVPADRLASLPPEQRAQFRFVAGHVPFGVHQHLPRGAKYVTVVRDPVVRVASHYHHYRSMPQVTSPERDLILEEDLSLEDWVFKREFPDADNLMVRVVSGRMQVPYGKCPDDMLDEALEHIHDHFATVLIQERMPDSMAALSMALRTRIPTVKRLNVNEHRTQFADIDARVAGRIQDLNRLDDRFYRLMLERFG